MPYHSKTRWCSLFPEGELLFFTTKHNDSPTLGELFDNEHNEGYFSVVDSFMAIYQKHREIRRFGE